MVPRGRLFGLANVCQAAGHAENAVDHETARPVLPFPTLLGVLVGLVQLLPARTEELNINTPRLLDSAQHLQGDDVTPKRQRAVRNDLDGLLCCLKRPWV